MVPMSLNRRSFLRNLGSLVGALSVGLTVFKPQKRKVLLLHTDSVFSSQVATMTGYKGAQFLETGCVYAPYIPLVQTCDLVHPDSAKQFAQRWASKRLTPRRNLLQLA